MAMDIGDAKLTISAEDKTQAAFNKVGKSTKNMSASFRKAGLAMTAVGTGLVLALGKMVNAYSKAGDEVAKMAKRTGFATETLSELRHVAKLSGTELGSIEKATKRMSRAIIDADRGLETYARAFRDLGLDITALRAQSPEEQFWAISGALADLEDHTLKAALAQEVFGRAGSELLPMLAEGSDAIARQRQEAHDLGIVFDASAAKAAEAFEDAKTRLQAAFQGIGASIAQSIMPALTELIDKLKLNLEKVILWAKEHPKLTEALVKFGAVMAALLVTGGPMLMMASVIPKIVAGFVILKTALLTSIIPALVKATLAFIALLASMGPWGWAALAGGIAAAGAAMAGLGALGLLPGTPKTVGGKHGMVRYNEEWLTREEYAARKKPSMQFGGIVPGAIGQPIPIIAHGGEPFGGVGGRLGNTYINVNVEGSVVSERELIDGLRRAFILEKERNTTTGF